MSESNGTTELELRPEVAEFVARVRARLSDLDAEEQRELTEGLEADLGDLVAEQGVDALGDPRVYARELRTAAGFEPEMDRARDGRPLGERLERLLDSSHTRWDRAVAGLPGSPWELLVAVRPLWWVFRAWLAVELLDLWLGSRPTGWVPPLQGFGLVLTVLSAVLSVQIGRGRLWPGTRAEHAVGARSLLLVLNVLAVLLTPSVVGELPTSGQYVESYSTPGVGEPGLFVNGRPVENVYPYDAQGRPLTGVQLFDQAGRPLAISHDPAYLESSGTYRVTYPWRNGDAKTYNVFPLPQRAQPGPNRSPAAFEETNRPTITPPLAAVPPVSLPGIEASVLARTTTGTPRGGHTDGKRATKQKSQVGR
jgi:hypothetical protein